MGNNKKKHARHKPSSSAPESAASGKKKEKHKASAEELFERGQLALQYDNFDVAVDCFRRATAAAPRDADMASAFGALLADLGMNSEAASVLKKAILLSPTAGHEK